jgi:hypothetical protein
MRHNGPVKYETVKNCNLTYFSKSVNYRFQEAMFRLEATMPRSPVDRWLFAGVRDKVPMRGVSLSP